MINTKSAANCIIAFAMVAFVSCGSDAGTKISGDSNGSGLQTAAADLSGEWSYTKIVDGNCTGETYPETETGSVNITQSGNTITAVFPNSSAISGTISGSSTVMSGNYSSNGGTVSMNVTCTLEADGKTIAASGNWTWSSEYTSYTCSGTVNITAVKINNGAPYVSATIMYDTANENYSLVASVYTNSSMATPVSTAIVTLNGEEVPAIGNGSYQSDSIRKGSAFSLNVSAGDVTCTSGSITWPQLTAPQSGSTLAIAEDNVISWTPGVPAIAGEYTLYIMTDNTPIEPQLSGDALSYTIPANTLTGSDADIYFVFMGYIPVNNAASGSLLTLYYTSNVSVSIE